MKNSGVMCPRDGFVVFRQSELLTGRLGKVTLGGSNKTGLFQVRCRDPGMPHETAPVLVGSCSRFGPLTSRGIRYASRHIWGLSSAVQGRCHVDCSVCLAWRSVHALVVILRSFYLSCVVLTEQVLASDFSPQAAAAVVILRGS